MKKLLASLALCIPFYLVAQGFGIFGKDQPYFSEDATVDAFSSFATNLTFRWVATDVANGTYVSNWVDRIVGRELLTNGAPVTKDLVNGQGLYVQGVTNASAAGPLLGGFRPSGSPRISNVNTNNGEVFGIGWMLKPQFQVWYQAGSSPQYGFYNYNTNVGGSHRFTHFVGNTPFDKVQSTFASITYNGTFVGDYMDFAVICSNWAGTSTEFWFTNGVSQDATSATSGSDGQWPFTSTLAGVSNQLANAWQGYVQEIWFRTNSFTTRGDFTNFAKDLHASRLAIYGTNYAIPSWPSLANNPTTNSDSLSVYDVATITGKVNGDTITSIPDSGPKAYHLRATNSPLYLTHASTNSGLPHIGFNIYGASATNQMAGTNFSTTYPQPTTVIMVFDGNASVVGTYDVISDNCQAPGVVGVVQQALMTSTHISIDSGGSPFTMGTTRTGTASPYHVYEFYFKDGSSYIKRDGDFYSIGGTTGTDGRLGIAVNGGRNWDLNNVGNMNFYWMGIYTNTLSTATRSNIYSYLGNRFSIPVRITQN